MAPKRIKAKVPTSVAEDGENKPRKRGVKVLIDAKEISNVPELSDAVTTENGSGGDTGVVSKAVAKRGRKGAKEPVKEISNGAEVEVEEVAAEPAKEDAKVSKGAKRGGKKEKPVPKPAPLKDKEKEGSDSENEESVEALAEKAPSKAVGRKRGKPADVDSSEKPEISETETKITAKNKKTTNKVAEAAPPTKGKKENKRGRKEDLGGEVEKKQSSRKREAKSSDGE